MSVSVAEPLSLDSPRALARAISRVERGGPDASGLMRRLGARRLQAWTIGITGPPGAGKSTLVDRLIAAARATGRTVGVIAVDPSSPFSGGAILGDRVRMMSHSGDSGVFVRSMAARDSLGGLAAATRDAARLLDAYGFDIVMLETVGVGQSELDIVKVADSIVVIAVPGLGDAIQTLKAGVLEVADLFVVNMADRPGAQRTVADLKAMQQIGPKRDDDWKPPILETIATDGTGVDLVWAELERHYGHLKATGGLDVRRRRRIETEVVELVERDFRVGLRRQLAEDLTVRGILEAACTGTLDPHSAAEAMIAAMGSERGGRPHAGTSNCGPHPSPLPQGERVRDDAH